MRGAQGDPVAAFHFAAQYMQRPIALEGNLFKAAWLIPYKAEDLPPIEYRVIMADTAQKVGTRNDYTVFQHWGLGRDGRAYLLDQVRGKFEAPELIKQVHADYFAAGADVVDTAISSMSLGPGHNPTESLVAMLEGTPYTTNLDAERLIAENHPIALEAAEDSGRSLEWCRNQCWFRTAVADKLKIIDAKKRNPPLEEEC